MASLSGTNLSARVVPWTTEDTYATHESQYGKGGWHEVATIAERDAIPSARLSDGMGCYVRADNKLYIYNSSTTSWAEYKPTITASDIPDLTLSKITDVTATATEVNVLDGITATTTELNYVDGVTSNIQTQLDNKVTKNDDITAGTHSKITYDSKGLVTGGSDLSLSDLSVTATATELNVLDGITATTTELNYVDGVTSNIQTQLDNKVVKNDDITGATHSKITYDSKGLVTGGSDLSLSDLSVTATATELNILDGATLTTTELNYVDGVTSNIQTQLNGKLTSSDIYDGYDSTATDKALSANKGNDLNTRLQNVESRGRFLSNWDCTTGKPVTDPTTELPYTYRTGDYYIISTIASGTGTNYRPSGTQYTGAASTTAETAEVATNDTYLYDGSNWILQKGSTKSVTFESITGNPTDNTNLATALGNKVDKNNDITAATHTKITYDKKGLVTGGSDITLSDVTDVTATATEVNVLDGITASTTELNVLDGITATTAELNYTDGVTSNIQTQLNNKLGKNTAIIGATHSKITYDTNGLVTGGSDLALSDLSITATATEINVLDGITATTTELNYVDGVTSNIQIQLNNKSQVIWRTY